MNVILPLWTYSDANWNCYLIDHCFTPSYYLLLSSSLISWLSVKQFVVVYSRVEYRALTDATFELLWLGWLLRDMSAPQTTSTAYPL